METRCTTRIDRGQPGLGLIASGVVLFLMLTLAMVAPATAQAPAIQTSALDVMLVLDNSGSMKRNDPERALSAAVSRFVGGLRRGDRLGIVVFDQNARVAVPLQAVDSALSEAHDQAARGALDYRGQRTDTPAAVERALYELRQSRRDGAQSMMLLVTDGIVDTGDKLRDRDRSAWLREDLAAQAERQGTRIFQVALGNKADFRLLQSVAARTGGEYYRVDNASALGGVFDLALSAMRDLAIVEPPASPETASTKVVNKLDASPQGVVVSEPAAPPVRSEQASTTVAVEEIKPLREVSASEPAAVAPSEPLGALAPEQSKPEQSKPEQTKPEQTKDAVTAGADEPPELAEPTAPAAMGVSAEEASTAQERTLVREERQWLPKQTATDEPGSVEPRDSSATVTIISTRDGDGVAQDSTQGSIWAWALMALGVVGIAATVYLLRRKSSSATQNSGMPEMWLMRMEQGPGAADVKLERKTTAVGRLAPDPKENIGDLVLSTASVGRRHALLEFRSHRLWVSDLNSANGTFVNGAQIGEKRVALNHGDRVRFADIEFELSMTSFEEANATVKMNASDIIKLNDQREKRQKPRPYDPSEDDSILDFDELGMTGPDIGGINADDTLPSARELAKSMDSFFGDNGFDDTSIGDAGVPKRKRS